MTKTFSEMKVFHIDRNVNGKPLAIGPFVMRPVGDGTIAVAAVRFEDHCSSRSACSNQPITCARWASPQIAMNFCVPLSAGSRDFGQFALTDLVADLLVPRISLDPEAMRRELAGYLVGC